MLTIVYASLAGDAPTGEDLIGLLEACRRRNHPAGVSGMLLYARGTFLQQLEGEDAIVAATFDRIRRDDRHHSIRVFSRRTVAERRFPGWSMGFTHPDEAMLALRLAGYLPPGDAPLRSAELVRDAEAAEALLGLYAVGGG